MDTLALPVKTPQTSEDLERNFSVLAPQVLPLLPQAQDRINRDHPAYIGYGKLARVFRAGAFAVRLPHGLDNRDLQAWTTNYTAPLLVGSGAAGLEQIVGASSTHGITVSYEATRAVAARHLSNEALRAIPAAHIRGLGQAFLTMHQRDLVYDEVGDNLLYGPTGFTVIDYAIRNPHTEPKRLEVSELISRAQSYICEVPYGMTADELQARHRTVAHFAQQLIAA